MAINDQAGLADYIADNYGACARGSDCYWGRDEGGRFNGCLKIGWRGRACVHWEPTTAKTEEELIAQQRGLYASDTNKRS